jgi:peptidoglycan/xylan/chitin deacetylase (PgdA/CDA1 family)
MKPVADNRAVSAAFRVFGGPGRALQGDAVRRLAGPGANARESRVLGVLVPLVVAVAVVDGLARRLGPGWTVVAALPAWLVAMHALTPAIGVVARWLVRLGGTRDAWIWRCWLMVLCGWAAWAWSAGGWVRWPAAGWLMFGGLNLLAAIKLAWRWVISPPGRRGVVIRVLLAVLLHLLMVPLAVYCGWWALAWGAALAVGWAQGTFDPNSQGFGPVATHCDGAGVWVTIDDGPDPQTTPRLLEVLDEQQVRATFFLIGERAERHPELAREIVARGHQVANHTATHPRARFWAAGPARTRREVVDGSRMIEAATGLRPCWFRAPVGHSNLFTHPATDEAGLRVIGWTRRGLDGTSTRVPAILRRLTRNLQRGDILVVHDATPVAAEVLEGLLERIKLAGLRCELPECPADG